MCPAVEALHRSDGYRPPLGSPDRDLLRAGHDRLAEPQGDLGRPGGEPLPCPWCGADQERVSSGDAGQGDCEDHRERERGENAPARRP